MRKNRFAAFLLWTFLALACWGWLWEDSWQTVRETGNLPLIMTIQFLPEKRWIFYPGPGRGGYPCDGSLERGGKRKALPEVLTGPVRELS